MFNRPAPPSSWHRRRALLGSTVSHAALLLLAVALARSTEHADPSTRSSHGPAPTLVWLHAPGRSGGGGGGGGDASVTAARRAEAPGRDRTTVQVAPPADPATSATPASDPPPQLDLTAAPLASGVTLLAGAIDAQPAAPTNSRGPGEGATGGPTLGNGDGPGRGDGIGPGRDGETGGEYAVGSGVSAPRLLRDAKPQYTADAMRARIQGTVGLSCVVDADGRVRDCRLTRSLDARYGLDLEAIRAAQRWQFEPGRRGNAPVPVRVAIEMAFTVR
jgi:periplasmic protein TonB